MSYVILLMNWGHKRHYQRVTRVMTSSPNPRAAANIKNPVSRYFVNFER